MAKGAVAKEAIFQKMLNVFEGSFMWNGNKELRIPFNEEGTEVQIKVTLTAAKDNVYPDGAGEVHAPTVSEGHAHDTDVAPTSTLVEPTEEEKHNVEALLKALNL